MAPSVSSNAVNQMHTICNWLRKWSESRKAFVVNAAITHIGEREFARSEFPSRGWAWWRENLYIDISASSPQIKSTTVTTPSHQKIDSGGECTAQWPGQNSSTTKYYLRRRSQIWLQCRKLLKLFNVLQEQLWFDSCGIKIDTVGLALWEVPERLVKLLCWY